ncbi:hypothetical protein DFH07DRAFT_785274 [Mycena maculata]|uniref:Calcineurin-like phosphoesterase domain-containing protein n=1 Tax=Mycena maculata TaxID=230809 RepID=A0AAD7HBH7_9AGAR|nr:hypothetical protein DFH07DRAFT_785274 [Mycena maculata]
MLFLLLAVQFLLLVAVGASSDSLLSAVQNTEAISGTDIFLSQFTSLCIRIGAEDPDVCTRLIAKEGPILAHDLHQINAMGETVMKLCDTLLRMCVTKAVNPFTVQFPKPVPANPRVFKSCGRPPASSEANCTKPICCMDFVDSPVIPAQPAGLNENVHCGSPVLLVDSMLEEIESFSPVFSIFTGDVIFFTRGYFREVMFDLQAFNTEMAARLTAPIFPSLGNHDSAPDNVFACTTSHTANNSHWVYNIQSAGWEQWVDRAAALEVKHTSGSYSTKVSGMNLHIIAVNTRLVQAKNALQATENASKQVWIIGHILLGKEDVFMDQVHFWFFSVTSIQLQGSFSVTVTSEQIAANTVGVGLFSEEMLRVAGVEDFKYLEVSASISVNQTNVNIVQCQSASMLASKNPSATSILLLTASTQHHSVSTLHFSATVLGVTRHQSTSNFVSTASKFVDAAAVLWLLTKHFHPLHRYCPYLKRVIQKIVLNRKTLWLAYWSYNQLNKPSHCSEELIFTNRIIFQVAIHTKTAANPVSGQFLPRG